MHQDYKSHTGATMTSGKGTIQAGSAKQKINTRSSTEAEVVSNDNMIAKVMWTKPFLQAQGHQVKDNILY